MSKYWIFFSFLIPIFEFWKIELWVKVLRASLREASGDAVPPATLSLTPARPSLSAPPPSALQLRKHPSEFTATFLFGSSRQPILNKNILEKEKKWIIFKCVITWGTAESCHRSRKSLTQFLLFSTCFGCLMFAALLNFVEKSVFINVFPLEKIRVIKPIQRENIYWEVWLCNSFIFHC